MVRKYKREMLKKELDTNKINKEFHKRYGYIPNVTKYNQKLIDRLKKKIRKLRRKKAKERV